MSDLGSFKLESILVDPPKFFDDKGQLVSYYRIDETTCIELSRRLKPGMKTLETGGGVSTVLFAAKGCDHVCIMPDAAMADRVRDYCRSAGIDAGGVRFVIEKSCNVIPQIDRSAFDLILIDGCHGFPTMFVDFYYAARALKLGGTLIVDDMHIYTCHLVASFMQSDPGWIVDLFSDRVAFGTKVADTIDADFWEQPFVMRRSASWGKGKYARVARPLMTAGVVVDMVRSHGVRVTAQRITNSILRRVGLR
jgi:hypothetical protein